MSMRWLVGLLLAPLISWGASLQDASGASIEATAKSFYARLIEPGEYVLTGVQIKLARSTSDVSIASARRSTLWKDEKALGGTFKVAAGETVYIGNFFLDCYQEPQLWATSRRGRTAGRHTSNNTNGLTSF